MVRFVLRRRRQACLARSKYAGTASPADLIAGRRITEVSPRRHLLSAAHVRVHMSSALGLPLQFVEKLGVQLSQRAGPTWTFGDTHPWRITRTSASAGDVPAAPCALATIDPILPSVCRVWKGAWVEHKIRCPVSLGFLLLRRLAGGTTIHGTPVACGPSAVWYFPVFTLVTRV